MNILFFDTETSKFAVKDLPATDRLSSVPVQYATILQNGIGRIVNAQSTIIRRTGWAHNPLIEIEDRCVDIHGITNQITDVFGEDPTTTLLRFQRILNKADLVVAHNINFDVMTMDNAMISAGLPPLIWPEQYCTMRQATNIIRMPNYGSRPGYKWPKLSEAYRFATGKTLSNAHDALADCYGCRAVYKFLTKPPIPALEGVAI